jgi:fumarylpyruvate hydrolase
MGFSEREAPFFFMKPADSVLPVPFGSTGEMPYPGETANLHHEIELVVAIGRGGRNIAQTDAAKHIWGYAVGLDMTRRDLQFALRDKGRPWDVSKGFDHSAPISPLKPISVTGEISSAAIWLEVNGQKRQSSDVAKLIWNVSETIEHLSKFYALAPGDLIFTGTPEGVGAVKPGDLMSGGIAGIGTLQVRVI